MNVGSSVTALLASTAVPLPTPAELESKPHFERNNIRIHYGAPADLTQQQIGVARGTYYGMVRLVDDQVGKLLRVLKDAGRLEDTVIVTNSDHGVQLGKHGNWLKRDFYDTIVRVLLASFPRLQTVPRSRTKTESRAPRASKIRFSVLSRKRDIVVHKGMLVPNTTAMLGITEGRSMKLGLTFPVHPLEDSEAAMDRYLRHAAANGDFLEVLIPDDDSLPCLHRRWQLEDFDEEVVELCARTWLRVGETIKETLLWLGEEDVPALALECRHSTQRVQYRLFDRDKLLADFCKLQTEST